MILEVYKQLSATTIDTLRLEQNGCDFADNIFNAFFLQKTSILIQISLKFS